MDRGELYKSEFTVSPVEDGGFVVFRRAKGADRDARYAFSNLADLMVFLKSHEAATFQEKAQGGPIYIGGGALGGGNGGIPLYVREQAKAILEGPQCSE